MKTNGIALGQFLPTLPPEIIAKYANIEAIAKIERDAQERVAKHKHIVDDYCKWYSNERRSLFERASYETLVAGVNVFVDADGKEWLVPILYDRDVAALQGAMGSICTQMVESIEIEGWFAGDEVERPID